MQAFSRRTLPDFSAQNCAGMIRIYELRRLYSGIYRIILGFRSETQPPKIVFRNFILAFSRLISLFRAAFSSMIIHSRLKKENKGGAGFISCRARRNSPLRIRCAPRCESRLHLSGDSFFPRVGTKSALYGRLIRRPSARFLVPPFP